MNKQEFKYSKFFEPRKYRYPILLLVFLILGQDLMLELPVLFHKLQAVRFKGKAEGKVEKLIPKKIIRQTLTGNRAIIIGYKVKFSFVVGGKTYEGNAYVPNGTTQYASTFSVLFNNERIVVKYNPDDPSVNTIELPYEDIFLSM